MLAQAKEVRLFRPAIRRRLHEEVAEQIRDAILDGHFRPGDKLPPERELAAHFGVNRTSVREAIKVLEGLGLVSARQGDGVIVQPVINASFELLAPMIFHRGRVDVGLLGELQDVVAVLLYGIARAAVARIEPQHVDEIRKFRERIADVNLAREERFAAGRDLLVFVADLTGNRVWQMVARRFREFFASPLLQAAREQLNRDPAILIPMIDGCLEALEAKRPEEAVRRLRNAFQFLGEHGTTAEETTPHERTQTGEVDGEDV